MATLNAYSGLDRLLHRIAFLSPEVQKTAAEIEDRIFARRLDGIETRPPVFITSLPRAGTTVLLTALASVPELATHTYRNMPFIMAPLLWDKISGGFRTRAISRERTHGDGIDVSYDSPEAFEEVIWQAFWPDHFLPDRITLWSAADARDEVQAFMRRHFAKIVALRRGDQNSPGRYLSKNNANIARLDLLPVTFPGADILIPVRDPLSHAASLLRQHRNFLDLHERDAFGQRYMRDIGHYEFGALHCPIRFERFDDLTRGLTPLQLDYWLGYWIAAFHHIAARRDRVHLVDYMKLCQNGIAAAEDLCRTLDLDLIYAARIGAYFNPPRAPDPDISAHQSSHRDRAEALYRDLIGG